MRIVVSAVDWPASGFLQVSVSDEGSGIPQEEKSKLFARYLESAKGSGLGMSIFHALVVERYKGLVRVEDRIQGDPSKGRIVILKLRHS